MISIIDYNAGNIGSVKNALERLGQTCIVTSNPEEILSANGVIFPGQGRAGAAMLQLQKNGIDKIIARITKPFLGICLGMQLLATSSEEDNTRCLSIFKGACCRLAPIVRVPHLGWNKVVLVKNSPLTANIQNGSFFYFVHSYYVDGPNAHIVAKTSYGFDFASIMQKDNFFAVQFHPEKSGEQGLRLLENFCRLCS